MEGNVINYGRVVLGQINAWYLTVPTCNETRSIHTIVLDLEDPFVSYTLPIRGHKIFASLAPYLLLVHVDKFFANGFLSFFARSCDGMVPSFMEGDRFFWYRHGI